MTKRRRPNSPRAHDPLRPHFVYSHRNAAGEIIYIGCTVNVDKRSRTHRYTARWWPEVAEVVVEGIRPDRASGQHLEMCLIIRHEPRYNTQHNAAALALRNDWLGELRQSYDKNAAVTLAGWTRLAEIDADIAEHVLPVIRERIAQATARAAA